MGSILGTIFAFALVFGILVFIHEFGHFFMAKLMKVKVEVFSFGLGKRLFGIKKGDTDYRISIIPVGGYVKFSGEDVFDREKKLAPHDFMARKRWQRFLVILMGPVMNILLAIFLFTIINIVGVSVPEYQGEKPVIGWIEPGSPAERANLKIDDEILSVNNKKTKTWSDVELAVLTKPEKLITLEIKRESEVFAVELMTGKKTMHDMGYAGFFGKILTQVTMVLPNTPAEKAGLKPGDVILEINDEPAYYFQFIELIPRKADKELKFLIERECENPENIFQTINFFLLAIPNSPSYHYRDIIKFYLSSGESLPCQITLKITPRLEGKIGKIGIGHVPKSVIKKYGLFSAAHKSLKESLKLTFLVINTIKDLITGEASVKQIGGPIEIASISYIALRLGLLAMIQWIALISLQLGIVNLFPIPILDGGHILVILLEGITRRDFSPTVKKIVMQIGFVIFIFLIIFIILNDISKRLPNGWNSFIPW